jgi:uncharacterized tellurite resistance protein B-like protein
MLRAIKRALAAAQGDTPQAADAESRQLQLAVAVLLHESRRADYEEGADESAVAVRALGDLFGLDAPASAALLEEGRARAQQLASFYPPVSVIKRDFSLAQRIRLLEHLWRIAFADGRLNLYEDHYVRKIARLLYIPHTESMLARNRARG